MSYDFYCENEDQEYSISFTLEDEYDVVLYKNNTMKGCEEIIKSIMKE